MAPRLPAIDLGAWSGIPQVRDALQVNVLFLLGLALAPLLAFVLRRTHWGLVVRTVGDSRDAALALGFHVNRVRALCTMIGGFLAGVGGSFLSLYYPGSWNEGLSSGQGLMAVALVVFARWEPLRCLWSLRRGRGARAGAPVGRDHERLLSVQCRAVCPDALPHARDLLARPRARGHAAGAGAAK